MKYPKAFYPVYYRYRGPKRMFVKIGEFREPKRGEWFLSGAIPEAYQAFNNLSTKYHILKEVK